MSTGRAGDYFPTTSLYTGGVVKMMGMFNHETVLSLYIRAKMDHFVGKRGSQATNVARISAKRYSSLNVTYFAQYIFQHVLDNLSRACESARAFLRRPTVVEHIPNRKWFFYAANKKVM